MALLNWEMFLERVERNEKLALELACDLLLSLDSRVELLELAMERVEIKRIEQSSHALRGLIALYGGGELLLRLKEIEEASRRGDSLYSTLPVEIRGMIGQLKSEVTAQIQILEPRGKHSSQEAFL